MKLNLKNQMNSIKFKLISAVTSIIIGLCALSIIGSLYAMQIIKNEIHMFNQKVSAIFITEVDNELSSVNMSLSSLYAFGNSLDVIMKDTLNTVKLYRNINDLASLHNNKYTFFAFHPSNNKMIYNITDYEDIFDRKEIQSFLRNQYNENQLADMMGHNRWFLVEIDEKYYLFSISPWGKGFAGVWCNINQLSKTMNAIQFDKTSFSVLVGDDDNLLTELPIEVIQSMPSETMDVIQYLSVSSNEYIAVKEPSEKGNFTLYTFTEKSAVLKKLQDVQKITVLIALIFIASIPIYFVFVRKNLSKPLDDIIKAMKMFKNGDLEVQVAHKASSYELGLVGATFNEMTKEIAKLKIDIYEKELDEKQTKLEFYQLQIRPHFLLNSLNIVYTLAQVKDYELIKELSVCLSDYFRYILDHDLKLVTLESELHHISNYLQIQYVRYPGLFTYNIEVTDELKLIPFPPFVLQSFAENSIQHGMDLDQHFVIKIEANILEIGIKKAVKLVVTDNGSGFPKAVLDAFKNGTLNESESRQHIGLFNVVKRLELIYGSDCLMILENVADGGAQVTLILPIEKEGFLEC